MNDKLLALPLQLADQIAAYVLACPTPPGVGAGQAYAIVEALKGLGQAPEAVEGGDSPREANAEQSEVGPAEIIEP